ncbi:MAG TPA: acyl carrier protein [Candidatus Coprenecus merdipullorum]|nr:acyl carrier protein [Candidatus Coprenecus merdipullorum]
MSNLEKYNGVFRDVFMVEDAVLNDAFDNKSVDGWDSVKQLALTTALEDTFDIMLDAEDILELTSYTKGKEILKKCGINLE